MLRLRSEAGSEARVVGGLLLAASGSLALARDAGAPPPAHPPSSGDLIVIASAETRGELLPCDCPQRPRGGAARRAGLLSEVTDSGAAALVVELGEVFPPPARMDDPLHWAAGLGCIYAEMGYDLVVLGDEDRRLDGRILRAFEEAYRSIHPDGRVVSDEAGDLALVPLRTSRGGVPVQCLVLRPEADPADVSLAVGRFEDDPRPLVALLHGSLTDARRLGASLRGAHLLVIGDGATFGEPHWIGSLPVAGPGTRGETFAFTRLSARSGTGPLAYLLVEVSSRYRPDPRVARLVREILGTGEAPAQRGAHESPAERGTGAATTSAMARTD